MPLKADIAHLYSLKAALEDLLGNQVWLDLKETTALKPWRKHILRALDALDMAVEATVQIRDDDWMHQIKQNLNFGREGVRAAKDIDDILDAFSATLLKQVFLQIGSLPSRQHIRTVTLKPDSWCLDGMRTVQYVQSLEQLETVFLVKQRREIGFEKQIDLQSEYRSSGSALPFSKWCTQDKS